MFQHRPAARPGAVGRGTAPRSSSGCAAGSTNARRVFYWGYHNDDPKQMFRSSLAMNQVLDTPPGELPPFVAYRLNGEPIPLERGGPVRMVVPWAHGFKSIKWLQKIVLTNRYEANDTYAEQNNDPESYLKTAAYFDEPKPEAFAAGDGVVIRGTAMVGWPGLERVEYWLRPDTGTGGKLAAHDAAWGKATWKPVELDPPPSDWGNELPNGNAARRRVGIHPRRQTEGMADAVQHRSLDRGVGGPETGQIRAPSADRG